MLKEDHEGLQGNDRFEGFAVELMDKIAQNLQFEYELYPVPDGQFGSIDENGEWNGMIGEVLNGVGVRLPSSCSNERFGDK